MNYEAAFLKVYGAAGAALDELYQLGEHRNLAEVQKVKEILTEGISAAENLVYPEGTASDEE